MSEAAFRSSADQLAFARSHIRPGSRQRSALTSGRRLLTGVDGRNAWVRRCKDIIRAHLADLGGKDNATVAEHSIIRRCAVLTTELERLEVRFALANEASAEELDLYQRTANSLRRLLEAVGLQRRPREITPDPLSYAREISIDGDAS